MNRPTHKPTKAEQKVFDLLLEGCAQQEIADALGIQLVTVKKHVSKLLEKYRYKSTIQLVVSYYKNQLNKGK